MRGSTRPGAAYLHTPQGGDCWGHTYYVIPPGQRFRAMPLAFDVHETFPNSFQPAPLGGLRGTMPQKNIALPVGDPLQPPINPPPGMGFERLQNGTNDRTLYMEVFYALGSKYTNVWRDTAQGPTLLTAQPLCEQSYEYAMYERACILYDECPSEGYELLRFGRILENPPKLPASPPPNAKLYAEIPGTAPHDARATWFRVPFAPGQQGYIDINASAIQKMSDADFPAHPVPRQVDDTRVVCPGWRTITDDGAHGPGEAAPGAHGASDAHDVQKKLSDGDGRWSPKALLKLASNLAIESMAEEMTSQTFKSLAGVVNQASAPAQKAAAVKQILRVPAVQEMLRGFICQAASEWDASTLEQRYGWRKDKGEQFADDPAGYRRFTEFLKEFMFWDKTGLAAGQKVWYFHPLAFIRHFRKCSWLSKHEMEQLLPVNYVDKNGTLETVANLGTVNDFINQYRVNLNKTLCKYGITTPARMAAFFAQATVETSWFKSQTEIDAEHKHYAPWYGRGFLQLTNSEGNKNIGDSNYYNYFLWRGRIPVQASPEQIIQWRNNVALDSDEAAQSAGFYWIAPQFGLGSKHHAERPSWYADIPAPNVRVTAGQHAYYSNESARRVAAYVNIPGAVYGHSSIYGLPERYSCYANALVVLADTPAFPSAEKGKPATDVPENFVLRQPW